MSDPYTREYYFDGGEFNTYSDELIPDNCLAKARNFVPVMEGFGNIRKRTGFAQGTALGGTCTSLYAVYHVDYVAAGTSRIKNASTNIQTITGTTTPADWVTVAGLDYMADGTNFYKITRASLTPAVWANIPAGTNSVATYNNFVFGLGSGNTNLRWTDLGTTETWTATNALTLTQSVTYEPLCAVRKWNDYLLVFGLNQIIVLQGYSSAGMTVVKTITFNGTQHRRSAISTPFGFFWWDSQNRGLCRMTELGQIDYPFMRRFSGGLGRAATYFDVLLYYSAGNDVHCLWNDRRQCVHVWVDIDPFTYGYNNHRIDYYPEKDSIWVQDALAGKARSAVYIPGSQSITIGGYATQSPYTYTEITQDNVAAKDDTASIAAYLYTKRRSDPLKSAWKTVQSVLITTKFPSGGAMTYGILADNQTTANQTFSLTQNSGTVTDNFLTPTQKHRKIQHYLTDSLNQRTEYYGIVETGTVDKIV